MPESWPLTLQQLWNEANFSQTAGETTVRTDMEYGPPKVRRRTSKRIDRFNGSLNLTKAQYITLENFYETTLAGGSKSFYFNHPIKETQSTFRFVGSWTLNSIGAGNFLLNFTWEEIA